MPQSLSNILIHLVFSTKERHAWLRESIRPELHAYMSRVLQNINCPALIINSVEDHIHILFALSRVLALASAVRDLKRASSLWLKGKGKSCEFFSWQAGYGAFSVSKSQVELVKRYIAGQAEKHKKMSFQEEYRDILRSLNISFDERYVWG